ncbi:MAG: DUF2029 domain-containing protein [Syntrophobacterales bacterium]|jgi:hypothetical protein|nr:DUF2029 domain-containing protein [Syntrophobacterales bacterium]
MVDKKQFLIKLVLALIFTFSLAYYYATINHLSEFPEIGDFSKFYMSARYFWEGKDIYAPVPLSTFRNPHDEIFNKLKLLPLDKLKSARKNLHPNLNPPFQTLLMSPLGLIGYEKAFWIYSFLSITMGLVALVLISRELATTKHDLPVLLGYLIVILCYFPSWVSIVFGQFSFILLLLITLGWLAARSGKDKMAGIYLGLAMSLKIFMGLFLIFFLIRRRWRLLSWFVSIFIILSLLPLLIMGIDTYKDYLSILSGITWYATSWNASFMGFFTRLFGGSENLPLINRPDVALALTRICSLTFLCGLGWVAWPREPTASPDQFDLGFSLTIVGMFLLSPLGWMYYFPALIIPAAVAWRLAGRLGSGIRYRILLVVAWILSTIPRMLIPSAEVNTPQLWFTWAGFYFYSLLLFSFILGSLARQIDRVPVPVDYPSPNLRVESKSRNDPEAV